MWLCFDCVNFQIVTLEKVSTSFMDRLEYFRFMFWVLGASPLNSYKVTLAKCISKSRKKDVLTIRVLLLLENSNNL